jgi:hypothetical protein
MSAKRWRLLAWITALIAAAALIVGMLDGDPGYGVDIPIAAVAFFAMLVCYVMEFRAKRGGGR